MFQFWLKENGLVKMKIIWFILSAISFQFSVWIFSFFRYILANSPIPDFITNYASGMHTFSMEMIATDLVRLAYCYDVFRGVEIIIIGNNQYSVISLNALSFSDLPNLKSIKIGELSFQYVCQFCIFGCSKLELLEIGNDSFAVNISKTKYVCNDRIVKIYNCVKLQSITFGSFVFKDYSQLDLHGRLIFTHSFTH